MKILKYFLILFMLVSIKTYSQTDTCFSEDEMIKIANKIYELKQKDSLNLELISKLDSKISLLELKLENDSNLFLLYDKKIQIKEDKISFYKDSYEYYKKKSRYSFIGGISVVLVASLVLHFSL